MPCQIEPISIKNVKSKHDNKIKTTNNLMKGIAHDVQLQYDIIHTYLFKSDN